MKNFFRLCFLLLITIITVSCGDKNNALEQTPGGSIAIGKFRLTGSAQSGPYALKLFKIDRYIADEFAEISAWTIVESERKKEVLQEAREIKTNQPSRSSQLIEQGLDKLENYVFGEKVTTKSTVPKEIINYYAAADYLLVGQMDGFDFDIDRQTNLVQAQGGQEVAATLNSRSYIVQSTISLRLIKVDGGEVVLAKRIFFRDKITSSASMETQVNEALKSMASRLVSETLLSLAGDIQVAAINMDGTLLLNRGRQSGLKPGMTLDLKRQGEIVKDPVTGEDLTRTSHKIGVVVIQSTTDNTATAKYTGNDTTMVKDLAVFDNTEFKKQDKGFQPIHMAIGTVTFTDNSPFAPQHGQRESLIQEIEQGLAQNLNGKLGIKIVDQHSQHIKDMLAQQMLSDLNQGREPGLPLGTLRGVDYLVFMSIVRSEAFAPKKQKVYLEVLGESVDQIKQGKGYMKAFVFLQDVNTAETAARTEVKFHKVFKKEITPSQAWSELIEGLLVSVNRSIFTQLRPLQVLSNTNSNSILLNHGKDVLAQGDELIVYGQGETVLDPYTGQRISNVGSVEMGRMKVTGYQANGYAMAALMSGDIPAVGSAVTVALKDLCKDSPDCDINTEAADIQSTKPKKQKVHQYNW